MTSMCQRVRTTLTSARPVYGQCETALCCTVRVVLKQFGSKMYQMEWNEGFWGGFLRPAEKKTASSRLAQ